MITPAHRRRLNAAMHELRRPLQAMALGGGPGGQEDLARPGLLELASSALAELDVEVNGGRRESAARVGIASCRNLVRAAVARRRAAVPPTAMALNWDAGPAVLRCDPVDIARALDNLLENAVEHGAPPFVVAGALAAGRVRITVANGARAGAPSGGADPRRGHGLRIVSEVAAEHGGRFAVCRTDSGCVAALELPLLGRDLTRAA